MKDIWKDYMTVVWEVPSSDGGSAITGYTLEQRDAFDVNYKFIANIDANVTQYQVCSGRYLDWVVVGAGANFIGSCD